MKAARSATWAPTVIAVTAAVAAMLILTSRAADPMLFDYGVGMVPVAVPWLAAVLAIGLALLPSIDRPWRFGASSVIGVGVALVTAWAIAMLPFDVLRIVGLVPLPLSGWGLGLRVLLLVAAVAALIPWLAARRASQARCAACGRNLPGMLDRLPRWPAVVAVVFALPYPVLRVIWVLGGTFGTTGKPVDVDPLVALSLAAVGWVLVAFTVLLLVGRGPLWARALFGLGGLLAGVALTVNGGLAAALAINTIAAEGLGSSPGADLTAGTFLLVYGSWFLAGLGTIAASWRYWARRREDCPACRTLLGV